MRFKYSHRHIKLITFRHIVFLLILIIVLSAVYLPRTHLFRIAKIDCYTQFGSCPPVITSSLVWLKNYSLIQPLPVTKVRSALSAFPDVKSVNLYRRLPATVVAGIILRQPVGVVGPSVLGASAVADDQGVIISGTDSASLPLLVLNPVPDNSGHLNPDQTQALNILAKLSSLSRSRIFGSLDGEILSAVLDSQSTVIIDIRQSVSAWYSSLQIILNRSRITAKVPHKIDMRFTPPVISF